MSLQNKAQYAPLSPAEVAKQDRRIIAGVRQGMTTYQIMRMYGFKETRIKAVAAKEGLTIAEGRKHKARERANG